MRTQQVIAAETGVSKTVDPFGGSYHLERQTDQLEFSCWEELERIDATGGMVGAVEYGYPQGQIAKASHKCQRRVESGELRIVSVSAVAERAQEPVETLMINEEASRRQEA